MGWSVLPAAWSPKASVASGWSCHPTPVARPPPPQHPWVSVPWAHGGDDLGSLRTQALGTAPSSPAAASLFAQLRPCCPNPGTYPGPPPAPSGPGTAFGQLPAWAGAALPSHHPSSLPSIEDRSIRGPTPCRLGHREPGSRLFPDVLYALPLLQAGRTPAACPPCGATRGTGVFWESDESVNGIPAPYDSPRRETPSHNVAAPTRTGNGGLGAAGRGLDGCWVLPCWGHSSSIRRRGRRRPADSLGQVGGRQEREGAANGKNCRKRLFTLWSIPEEGQGTTQADTHGQLPRGWGLTASHPTTHTHHGFPVRSRRGMRAPNWDPGGSPVPG